MKKLIMTVAVLACGASVVSAQVTSANIVGYSKDTADSSGFHISSMQFDNATPNTPQSVYGDQLPKGSKIYSFNGASYDIATYTDVFVPIQGLVTKWSISFELANGASYWVQVPSVADAVVSGEVPMDDSITNSIAVGFQMLSYPYPVSRSVNELGLVPAKGDKIYKFNGTSYDISTYTDVFVPIQGLVTKWSVDLSVGVGEGFWYEATVAQSWVAVRPFTP